MRKRLPRQVDATSHAILCQQLYFQVECTYGNVPAKSSSGAKKTSNSNSTKFMVMGESKTRRFGEIGRTGR